VVDFLHFPFVVPPSPFVTCERRDKIRSSFSFAAIFSIEVWLFLLLSAFAVFIQFTIVIKIANNFQMTLATSGAFQQLLDVTTGQSCGPKHLLRSSAFRFLEVSWALLLLVFIQGILAAKLYESAQMLPTSPLEDVDTFVQNVESGGIEGIVATSG